MLPWTAAYACPTTCSQSLDLLERVRAEHVVAAALEVVDRHAQVVGGVRDGRGRKVMRRWPSGRRDGCELAMTRAGWLTTSMSSETSRPGMRWWSWLPRQSQARSRRRSVPGADSGARPRGTHERLG